jgi:hypothetical protein
MNDELQILGLKDEYLPEVNQLIRRSNFFVIDAIHLITAYHAAPALFLHADSHFSVPVAEEMVRTIDIRNQDILKTVKKVIHDSHRSA